MKPARILGEMQKEVRDLLEDKGYMSKLKRNLAQIKDFCSKFEQDWVFVTSGYEGTGKSTLTLQEALLVNEDFRPRKHGAWNIKDYIQLCLKYRKKPFTPLFLDEAVKMFLSKESQLKHNIILVKIFVSNRSFQHFNFLNIPNFFWLEKYIREFRIRSLNYTFFDWKDPNIRYFAYYSKKRYMRILMDAKKARVFILDPEVFIKKYKPNFLDTFKPLPKDCELWKEYIQCKEQFQVDLLQEALEEVMKWEERGKIGFNENTDLEEFLRFLCSKYRLLGTNWLKFKIEEVARETMTRTETIQDLVFALKAEDYIRNISRSRYALTEKGIKAVKNLEICKGVKQNISKGW